MLYWLVCLPLCAVVFFRFLDSPRIDGYGRALFGEMISGDAFRPYVGRVLVPQTVRVAMEMIPNETRERLGAWLAETPLVEVTAHRFRWDRRILPEYALACMLMFGTLVGFAAALQYFFRSVYELTSAWSTNLVSLAGVALLPLFFVNYSHLGDFPQLLLATLGLALMARRRWRFYLLIFVLACLNKETAIVLVVPFWLHYRSRLAGRTFSGLLIAQVAIYAAARIPIALLFVGNPGAALEPHVTENVEALPRFLLVAAPPLALAAAAIAYRWREKPAFLRNALWMALPLGAAIPLFGNLLELRAAYDVYPIALILAAHGVASRIGRPWRSRIDNGMEGGFDTSAGE